MNIYICIYIYIYVHTYIHTYIFISIALQYIIMLCVCTSKDFGDSRRFRLEEFRLRDSEFPEKLHPVGPLGSFPEI